MQGSKVCSGSCGAQRRVTAASASHAWLPQRPRHATAAAAATAAAPAAPSPPPPLTSGQLVELECSRLALEGKGVCLTGPSSFVVLCDQALPGERLVAEIGRVRKGLAEARKVRTLSPHFNAVAPRCPSFGPCGGCSLQSLEYDAQLREKQRQVQQTLSRVAGGVRGLQAALRPAVPCQDTFAYRNKVQFTFSAKTWQPRAQPDQQQQQQDQQHEHQQQQEEQRQGKQQQQQGQQQAASTLTPALGEVVDRPSVGLLLRGSHDVVVPVPTCHLQDDQANQMLQALTQAIQQAGLLPYNHSSGKGFLKHIIIRSATPHSKPSAGSDSDSGSSGHSSSHSCSRSSSGSSESSALVSSRSGDGSLGVANTGAAGQPSTGVNSVGVLRKEYLVVLVTTVDAPQQLKPLVQAAVKCVPQVVGVVNKVVPPTQAGPARVPRGRSHILYGRSHLEESLCGLSFEVSAESFFQVNTRQAEVLYGMVREAAQLRPGNQDVVFDLYCGTGTIGLTLARDCKHLVGWDIVDKAIEDAQCNAQRNGIVNATFVCGDATKLAEAWTAAAAAAFGSGAAFNSVAAATAAAASVPLARVGKGKGRAGQRQAPLAAKAQRTLPKTAPPKQTAMPPAPASGSGSGSHPASTPQPAPQSLTPDVVIVDPARAGLSESVIALLEGCGARRVVYVSCNPATQARDLVCLVGEQLPGERAQGAGQEEGAQGEQQGEQQGPGCSPGGQGDGGGGGQGDDEVEKQVAGKDEQPLRGLLQRGGVVGGSKMANSTISKASGAPGLGGGRAGYVLSHRGPRFRLVSVQPVDLFPHTDHIETVAVLERVW